MYKKSIKDNSKYLVPFVEGLKYYGSDEIEHGIGTMIILNEHGDVLTCKHVAERFILNEKLSSKYRIMSQELKEASKRERKQLEKEYNLKDDTIVLSNIHLPFDIKNNFSINIILHNFLDLAVIRFEGLNIKLDNYPVFSKELPEQGQSVCKLGFAFPEYDIYEYSKEKDSIVLKNDRVEHYPLFPMDGIVTRLVMDDQKHLSMFETSTPGLRGQSGGPVFSPEGLIYGIQSMTSHLDLNFDVDQVVKRGYEEKRITFTPFINLGICVASSEIVKFLEDNHIEFKSK